MTEAMPAQIPIVLAANNNYVPHLSVTMLSAAASASRREDLLFYLLDAGISQENRKRLERLAAANGITLSIIEPGNIDLGSVDLKRYGVAATYRILIAEILPEEISRIIYLDCDIVVLDDLSTLFAIPLEGYPIAAVENLGIQPTARIGLEKGQYFNSGVLVMDLDEWRSRQLGRRVLSYMRNCADSLIFPDQDGLNATLKGAWCRLPLRWNQQPATYSIQSKLSPDDPRAAEYREAVAHPAVVHFLGRNKPWDYMTFHPLKEFYWHFLRETPWRGHPYENKSPLNVLKKAFMVEKWVKRRKRRRQGPVFPRTAD